MTATARAIGERLRVCFLIGNMDDGGAQVQCARILDELQRSGLAEGLLLYLHGGVHEHRLTSCAFAARNLDVRSNYDPLNILRIDRALRDFRPHLILTWMQACDTYGFFLRLRHPTLRWVVAERNSHYPAGDWRFRLRALLARGADAVICNSEAGRAYWRAKGGAAPLYVVPNIVVAADIGAAKPADAPAILSIGRLDEQKNPLVLADAFCRVAAQKPDLTLGIAGKGALADAVAARVAAAQVGERVRLLGFRADGPALIGAARLLVTLSHHEGTPNVLLEAVAAGVPAIVSDIPEHRAVLGDDYPFLVADYTDPGAAATVIIRALDVGAGTDDYAIARARMAATSGHAVAASYHAIFEELVRR